MSTRAGNRNLAPRGLWQRLAVSYSVLHSFGKLDENLPKARFRGLVEDLAGIDDEHRVLGVCHNESGICVEVRSSGEVALLNVDDRTFQERHEHGLGLDETLQRLYLAADGQLEALMKRTWEDT